MTEPTEEVFADIKDCDKSNFKCMKFPDNSIYYGEVAYFDKNANLV